MMGVFVQLNEGRWLAHRFPVGYVIQENGCWDWVGRTNRGGYGIWSGPKAAGLHASAAAHRIMYERIKGSIPHGKQLDHLCRNRLCVNPDHLEPVDNRTNVLRGIGHTAINARKTHCKLGHEFTVKNTLYIDSGTRRECRICNQRRRRKYEAKQKEATR